jgi:type I restriction-modification system DNA methylase subunit
MHLNTNDNPPTPKVIEELVERFENNREAYHSNAYNEARLRQEFLDPLFGALGWDMANSAGAAEAYKDVIHEDSIKVGSDTKAPDYCFRIGGARKFFVEAKKPAVNIKQDADSAFQLRRYAWSSKLPLSILTNFEGLSVYDCRRKPDKTELASNARISYVGYKDLVGKWQEVSAVFSREAVWKGYFDKYLDNVRGKKGTAEVDSAFLAEIERWRDLLARNIAAHNSLTVADINFAVQRTIDRLIFLRISEDRGIERYRRLLETTEKTGIYHRLCVLFKEADERYNSGLFHFYPDKDRNETPDNLTLRLVIDDKILKDIVKSIYYPESPYEFSVLPADILGQVYERFLGKQIRLTPAGLAKIEEKPEVKKAGGVFYTPTYVVEYIVKHTLEPLIVGKTPKDVAKLRIVDPACGSGSFLLGAYQHLLEWHRGWYEANDPAHRKEVYRGAGGMWRLSASTRRKILLNNIYGVDVDAQAVEVTKLSLLLKVLEGETAESVTAQLRMFHERALPDLGNNVKCGNSLVQPNFLSGGQMKLLGSEETNRINVFDWNAEFPATMRAGGFDAVIGNPPWGAYFSEDELEYLRNSYGSVVARMVDSYIYFFFRATQLAKKTLPIGFIVPSTILNQVDAEPIRTVLLERGVSLLANLGQGIFGAKVLNTATIVISKASEKTLMMGDLSKTELQDRKAALLNLTPVNWKSWRDIVSRDPDVTFFAGDLSQAVLLDRLRIKHPTLLSVLNGPIQRGVSPDIAEAHTVSIATAKEERLEKDLLRPSVSGSQIRKYQKWICDEYIIYTDRQTELKRYPNIAKRLGAFRHQNTCKEVSGGKHPWWALHRPRDSHIFDSPKLIGLTTAKTIELVYDQDRSAYVTDAMYVMTLKNEYNPWVFMGVMQSKLMLFLYRVSNQGESRVIPQIKASKLQTLPFPLAFASLSTGKTLLDLVSTMYSLNTSIASCSNPHLKEKLLRQIEATERHLDDTVYRLYDLSPEEVDLVEHTFKTADT